MYCPDFAIFGFKNPTEKHQAQSAETPNAQEASNADAR
jgi:hypothetical protein